MTPFSPIQLSDCWAKTDPVTSLPALTTGKPVIQVAQDLCISSNLLYYWKSHSQSTQLVRCGEFGDGPSDGEELNALGFELGGLLLFRFSKIHRWILQIFSPRI